MSADTLSKRSLEKRSAKLNHRLARRSTQPVRDMTYIRIVTSAALLLVGACSTTPMEYSANDICHLPPSVWLQMPTPPERELLFELADPGNARPVREHFIASSDRRELWFRDSSGNLQVQTIQRIGRVRGEMQDSHGGLRAARFSG